MVDGVYLTCPIKVLPCIREQSSDAVPRLYTLSLTHNVNIPNPVLPEEGLSVRGKVPLCTVNNLVYLKDIKRMLCGEMSKPTGAGLMMRREGKLAMFTSPSSIAFLCLVISVTSFSSNVHKYT